MSPFVELEKYFTIIMRVCFIFESFQRFLSPWKIQDQKSSPNNFQQSRTRKVKETCMDTHEIRLETLHFAISIGKDNKIRTYMAMTLDFSLILTENSC